MTLPRLTLSPRLASALLSVALLTIALIILWLGHWLKLTTSDTVTIREVAVLSSPPPPPPPPPVQQPMVDTAVDVQVQGAGPALQMLNIKQKPIDIAKPDVLALDTSDTQWQSLEVNWDAFDLNDLDTLPTLLTPVRAVFPKSLSRRGVKFALIKLDVMIDEKGQVSLIGVVENPYPELNGEIQKVVRNSRFSAPQKNNEPVRARFIWPIEIKS